MTEPGHDRLRASHADRERAIDVLRAAFAEGRLDTGEYTDRVGQVQVSRTYADLGALVGDLPVGPLGTLAPAPPPAVVPVPLAPSAPPPARAAKRRTPMSPLEIAALAIMAFLLPAVTIPVTVVAVCIGLARAGPDSQPRARLTAAAIMVILIGAVILIRHA